MKLFVSIEQSSVSHIVHISKQNQSHKINKNKKYQDDRHSHIFTDRATMET